MRYILTVGQILLVVFCLVAAYLTYLNATFSWQFVSFKSFMGESAVVAALVGLFYTALPAGLTILGVWLIRYLGRLKKKSV
jgi:hypothetical protein